MTKKNNILVRGSNIKITIIRKESYISLTDIARHKDSERSDYILQNWIRTRSTIEFLGIWEQLHNREFNSIEFDGFKNEAGSNSFSLTPKRWINTTNAIGIISKAGRFGGTFAHQDIAFEFASWISAEFKIYLLKEFQRLKQNEYDHQKLEWNVSRTLAKVNYKIHTDAIKKKLIPKDIRKHEHQYVFASEADLLNIALFGKTAQQWRNDNPDSDGNIRDFSTMEQLVVLSNLESMNAELIKTGISSNQRLVKLNQMAISQMKVLVNSSLQNIKTR